MVSPRESKYENEKSREGGVEQNRMNGRLVGGGFWGAPASAVGKLGSTAGAKKRRKNEKIEKSARMKFFELASSFRP